MRTLAVIPARYASSRFPGKPLALLAGKPMILHVCARIADCPGIDDMVVATDDERIAETCREAGFDVAMTDGGHVSGTDRLIEVARRMPADVYVNVQGDEPLIPRSSIETVTSCLREALSQGVDVATVYLPGTTREQDASTSVVHLVPNQLKRVMLLSRLPVPLAFKGPIERNVHLGLYAYTGTALERFAARLPGPIERAESIELMRFLEYGDAIACAAVSEASIGVDHPEDIARAEALLKNKGEA